MLEGFYSGHESREHSTNLSAEYKLIQGRKVKEISKLITYSTARYYIQGSAKRWALGCMNPASWLPMAMGREFTQPRDYLTIAQPCSPNCTSKHFNLWRSGQGLQAVIFLSVIPKTIGNTIPIFGVLTVYVISNDISNVLSNGFSNRFF